MDIKEKNSDISKLGKELEVYIAGRRLPKNDKVSEISHTCFGYPFGKYYISDNDNKKFLSLYQKVVDNGMVCHFVERPKEVSPLCIDIDFRLPSVFPDRKYDEENIVALISVINNIVTRYVATEGNHLNSYVTEKKDPSFDKKNNEYKDGFHIIYPNLALKTDMRYFIIEQAKKIATEKGIFNNVPHCNDMDDVFDTSIVCNNGWMMYGSRKDTGKMYKLTHAYDSNLKQIKKNVYKKYASAAYFSVRKFGEDDELTLKGSTQEEDFKMKMKMISYKFKSKTAKTLRNKLNRMNMKGKGTLPLVEQDDGYNSEDDIIDSEGFEDNISGDKVEKVVRKKASKADIKFAKKLVDILSPSRAESYEPWIYLGWCLKSVSDKLLSTWKEFSQKCPSKYDESECDRIWNESYDGNMTMGTLRFWASKDNPEKYSELIRERITPLLMKAEDGTDYSIAEVLYEMYKDRFVCVSISKKKWYEFQGNRWVYVEHGHTLDKLMSTKLVYEFSQLQSYYCNGSYAFVKDNYDDMRKKSDNIHKIMKQLRVTGFKSGVMKQCTTLFYNCNFEEDLDSNKDLLGFDNGVYDLKAGIFRAGLPEDMISMSVGYDYKEFSMNSKYVKNVEEFFRMVQPEDDMFKYLLTLLSSHLDGHNKQQRFIFFTGFGGSNGKSTSLDFLQRAMGQYASTVAPTLLTRKEKGASDARPELADKRGVRFIQMDEPEGTDTIYVGQLKRLSGNDRIQARALYGDPFYFMPQFKVILACNKLPNILAIDGGTWRRIRVTPWPCRFIDLDEEIENEYEHYKDPEIEEKMDKWKRAFMWLMLKKYYPIYRKNAGVPEPDKVKQESKDYQKKSDLYFEFLSEAVDITEDKKDKEKKDDVYDQFKIWYRQNYSGPVPTSKELFEYVIKSKYKIDIKGSNIIGIKFKNDEEDEEDFDSF